MQMLPQTSNRMICNFTNDKILAKLYIKHKLLQLMKALKLYNCIEYCDHEFVH